MKLRARLAAATAAATIPLAAALFTIDRAARHRAAEERLVAFAQATGAPARAVCEAAPARFGGARTPHPPGPGGPPGAPPPGTPHARPAVVYPFDTALRPQSPESPAAPAALVRALGNGDVAVAPVGLSLLDHEVEVLVRMPWREGPCAVMLARGTTDPSWGALLPESYLWLLPTLGALCAALAAAGPSVRRIRRLGAEVARAAAHAYTDPIAVEGSDEVAELGAAFNAAGAEIRRRLAEREAREQALRRFLANTTHDVMLPLTVLKGHLSTIREQAAAGEKVDARLVVSAMDEAHYTAALIQDLVAAARLEGGEAELSRSPIDLGALVRRVAGRHAPLARELGVSLDLAVPADPLVIAADVTLLEQAVSNVTYNAVHYNRPGGHVALVLDQEGEGFSLKVIDDGPGLPDEELSRLAERGYRGAEARSRRPDGQGLGLHIAARAAELHGLSLRLSRSEGGGLEVTFEGSLVRT